MSCNGCRVLRKGCSETCILRSCLHCIETPESQGNATLFLAKFFGRSDLMSLISAVPESQRPALFQSLLYEACGRTVNPVNGAVGLLSSGNWHVCQAAVETVLAGGALRPIPGVLTGVWTPRCDESSESFYADASTVQNVYPQSKPLVVSDVAGEDRTSDLGLPLVMPRGIRGRGRSCQVERQLRGIAASFFSGESEMKRFGNNKERELLNLFV